MVKNGFISRSFKLTFETITQRIDFCILGNFKENVTDDTHHYRPQHETLKCVNGS